MPQPRRRQQGFTLIELLIAMLLAATIGIALSSAFRLGLQHTQRTRAFYSELQEMQAVASYLRLRFAPGQAIAKGSDTELWVGRKDAVQQGLRCQQDGEQTWRLELISTERPKTDKAVTASDEEPVILAETLLDQLTQCRFEYLLADPDSPATAAAQGGSERQPTAYRWLDSSAAAPPEAFRLHLGGSYFALPPLVFSRG